MSIDPTVRDAMLAALPRLRAFAVSLTGNPDRADDLVQDTLMRAITHIDRFEQGTKLEAWLFTILRNLFYSEHRKRRREVEDPEGAIAGRIGVLPEQGGHLELDDLRKALIKLPPDQREVLLLVGAQGLSYEETAEICGCAVGTIKSRMSRARRRLAELLHLDSLDDLGPDHVVQAAIDSRRN